MEVSNYGWNEEKAKLNEEKHGVTFKEAIEVFKAKSGVVYFGEDQTEDYPEVRYTAAGFTENYRFLFVVYEEFEEDFTDEPFTRIIHAKTFQKAHLKHFRNPDDKRDIKTFIQP